MTESVGMCLYLVEKYGPTDLAIQPYETDYRLYLNWLTHADATLTFPQTVVLVHHEPGVADADRRLSKMVCLSTKNVEVSRRSGISLQ